MEEYIIANGLSRWVNEAMSSSRARSHEARTDFEIAGRNPANIPLLEWAAWAAGVEPDEVLKTLLARVARGEWIGRKRGGRTRTKAG